MTDNSESIYHACGSLMSNIIVYKNESGNNCICRCCDVCHPRTASLMKRFGRDNNNSPKIQTILESRIQEEKHYLELAEQMNSKRDAMKSLKPTIEEDDEMKSGETIFEQKVQDRLATIKQRLRQNDPLFDADFDIYW